uniref:PRC-barrel domain protein n=1 Tax=Cyanothece sp. (strain PCC 7425 / ATCC 29141) TaxID=395961 RepID=B8HX07_CYAP4
MPLHRLEDFYQDYRQTFGGDDIKGLDLYTPGGDKIGSVEDALVDQEGRFRYLVISTGILGFGKKILLPMGLARIDYHGGRVITQGMSKAQVEQLPEYRDGMAIDPEHERQIQVVYSEQR